MAKAINTKSNQVKSAARTKAAQQAELERMCEKQVDPAVRETLKDVAAVREALQAELAELQARSNKQKAESAERTKAAQQAELERLRAEKQTAAAKFKAGLEEDMRSHFEETKQTLNEKVEDLHQAADDMGKTNFFAASSQPEEESLMDRTKQAAMEMLMRGAGLISDVGPSWKRYLGAFFASAVLAYGAGHIIGTLAGYAMVGIASLGGSLLWAWLIMIIATILSIYVGMKIGQHVGNYILSGQIDRDVIGAYSKMKSWFGRKQIVIAA